MSAKNPSRDELRNSIAAMLADSVASEPSLAAPKSSRVLKKSRCKDAGANAAKAKTKPEFKLKPLHIAGLAMFGLFLLKPVAIIISILMVLWIVIGAYLAFGTERIHGFIARRFVRFEAKQPDRAREVRVRADALANKVEAALDKMPGTWADDIYLPDFLGDTMRPMPEKMRIDPFDRLVVRN